MVLTASKQCDASPRRVSEAPGPKLVQDGTCRAGAQRRNFIAKTSEAGAAVVTLCVTWTPAGPVASFTLLLDQPAGYLHSTDLLELTRYSNEMVHVATNLCLEE